MQVPLVALNILLDFLIPGEIQMLLCITLSLHTHTYNLHIPCRHDDWLCAHKSPRLSNCCMQDCHILHRAVALADGGQAYLQLCHHLILPFPICKFLLCYQKVQIKCNTCTSQPAPSISKTTVTWVAFAKSCAVNHWLM